jgi:2-keto-4-pentenoate hydratase
VAATSDHALNAIAAALASARQGGLRLDAFPGVLPETLDEAYRIQDAVAARLGGQVAGWKVAALSTEAAGRLGAERICGPILEANVFPSRSRLAWPADADRKVEAELAIRLKADLPARSTPYGMDEVNDAVGEIHAAMEIAGSSIRDVASLGPLAIVSDMGFNAGFVHGDWVDGWRYADLERVPASLRVGDEHSNGVSGDVPGGPLGAVGWLANHLRARGIGLRAGQWISTGCCGRMIEAAADTSAQARFAQRARVHVSFAAA